MLQTFLVTGGNNGNNLLSSTELLMETSDTWVFTGDLPPSTPDFPFPRAGLNGANVGNKILMTGIESYLFATSLK